ncbi:MAG: hypothetical protein IT450_17585 [Phycisphaerales bacterium]|nr:hypothetical protein [Phycisphaerales bacterium]
MSSRCPRCSQENPTAARFCARCGLSFGAGVDGSSAAGRVRDAHPLAPPPGWTPVAGAADLVYSTESSLGGDQLIGTEGLMITVMNLGYGLRDATFEIAGFGRDDATLFGVEELVKELPRGGRAAIEIASYRIPAPLRRLEIRLQSAEYA